MTKKRKQKQSIAVFMTALALGICIGNPKAVTAKAATQPVSQEAQMKADDSSWEYPGDAPTSTWNGEGTESSPYQISTAQDLANLSYMVNNGESYAGKYFKLTTDISLNDETMEFDATSGLVKVTDGTNTGYLGTGIAGTERNKENASEMGTWYVDTNLVKGNYVGQLQEWVPIGILEMDEDGKLIKQQAFEGIFEGNGKTVKGLYINTNKEYTGLFSIVVGATVENLTIDNSCLYSSELAVDGLAAQAEQSSIINCTNNATILSSDTSKTSLVAGLIGIANGSSIESCTNKGVINGSYLIAGVASYIENSIVKDTDNLADIYATSEAGGIAADIHGTEGASTVENCKNRGTITANGLVGGIAGFANIPDVNAENAPEISAYIKKSYNQGEIISADSQYTGGIMGIIMNGELSECSNSGKISIIASDANSYAGGVIGCAMATKADECKNLAEINGGNNNGIGGLIGSTDKESTVNECSNLGKVTGGTFVGGLVGFNLAVISECQNSSEVNAASYVGGIAGLDRGKIIQSENDGNITGVTNVGGIVGKIDVATGSLENDKNTAKIESTSIASKNLVGGIVGVSLSPIRACENSGEIRVAKGYGGGIAGQTKGAVSLSKNTGIIEVDAGDGYAGGVAAYVYGGANVTGSENSGSIIAENAGGIVGRKANDSSIGYCFNIGKITAKYAGGIIGENYSGKLLINNCGNVGILQVADAETEGKILAGIACKGGANAANTVSVINSYNYGNLDATKDPSKTSTGGIFGNPAIAAAADVQNCYYIDAAETDTFDGTVFKTDSEFKNGQVAWLLNNERNSGTQEEPLIWYQNLYGISDAYPVLDSDHAVVHYSEAEGYYNHVALKDEMIQPIAAQYVTGNEITLTEKEITVVDAEKTLVYGKDYTITSYKNNKQVGTATVTITGKGIYTGTATGSFQIIKKTEQPSTPAPTDQSSLPQSGTVYTVPAEKSIYTVSSSGTKNANGQVTGATVTYNGATDKKASSVIIPSSVTINGVAYEITSIAPNAFKNNKKVLRVTIENNIKKIGAKTFYGCKNLKFITIKTTDLTMSNVGSKAFKGINPKAVIKVPKKSFKSYQKLLKKKGVSSKVTIKK